MCVDQQVEPRLPAALRVVEDDLERRVWPAAAKEGHAPCERDSRDPPWLGAADVTVARAQQELVNRDLLTLTLVRNGLETTADVDGELIRALLKRK